ncbi:MAG: FAD-binding oxidoreductase [candidate division Zixibacteria bacterium]|nr:FAD-binding oxidoreductase [candidate division Zixibacteria bacterium]
MHNTDTFLNKLALLVPDDQFSVQADQLAVAAEDESTLPGVTPLAVVWALSTDEITAIVKLCFETDTPVTTRGAGSALEGSTIPSSGGIVLDVSRMTDIIDYWPDDLQVRVQPGIIYDDLNKYLKNDGLFFPPSPGGSGDIATVGGMVSTNASGIYSVKYGGTREYVLELEIVTGTGQIVKLGNRAIKRSSGYNLVDLMTGSEGTLGVITSVTIRLAGLPEGRHQTAFVFETEIEASRAVSEMRRYGLDLAAIEFLDRAVIRALNQLKQYGLKEAPSLFLEFHGPKEVLHSNAELAEELCTEHGGSRLTLGDNQSPWEIRHWTTEAIKHARPGYTILRNDVAFPISHLPEIVAFCHKIARENDITMHTFGHVGLGLLHALILARRDNKEEWTRACEVNDQIIRKTLEFEGTISGEHGIGLGHKDLFETEHGAAVELMRRIKLQFDPHSILNPGKIFDVEDVS